MVFSRFSWVYPKKPCRCSNKNCKETAETIENVESQFTAQSFDALIENWVQKTSFFIF